MEIYRAPIESVPPLLPFQYIARSTIIGLVAVMLVENDAAPTKREASMLVLEWGLSSTPTGTDVPFSFMSVKVADTAESEGLSSSSQVSKP